MDENGLVRYEINDTASVNNFHAEDRGVASGAFIYSRTNVDIINSVIKNSIVTKSQSQRGGAIAITNNDEKEGVISNVVRSYFKNNRLEAGSNTAQGGAIWSQQMHGKLKVDESYFLDNSITSTKSSSGGAIYNSAGNLEVTNSYFGNNTSEGNEAKGGAVYTSFKSSDSTYVVPHEFKNVVFEKNKATSSANSAKGGAAYMEDSTSFDNVHFISNKVELNGNSDVDETSNAQGGALYQAGYGNSKLDLNKVVFKDNSIVSNNAANAQGGGVVMGAKGGNIENTRFEGNSINNIAKTDLNDDIYNNEYIESSGGALYFKSGEGVFNINNSEFVSNTVSSNNLSRGGAISVDKSMGEGRIVNINNALFENNSVTSSADEAVSDTVSGGGGAIFNGSASYRTENYSVINIKNRILQGTP